MMVGLLLLRRRGLSGMAGIEVIRRRRSKVIS